MAIIATVAMNVKYDKNRQICPNTCSSLKKPSSKKQI